MLYWNHILIGRRIICIAQRTGPPRRESQKGMVVAMPDEIKFAQLMDKLYEFSMLLSRYQHVPRIYGSGEPLFMAEAHLLQTIGDYGQINITGLAAVMQKSKSAVSQVVDKLCAKGLVEKAKGVKDRKQVLISLSEAGRRVYDYHRALDERNYRAFLSRLGNITDGDIKRIECMIEVISEEVGSALRNGGPV